MSATSKIVESIARTWIKSPKPATKSQADIVREIIADFSCGACSKPHTVDTVELSLKGALHSAEKYLDDFCDVITEGKYTVISHKWGGYVDVSKIGQLNRNGTIIRYSSAKQAEEEAKKILMKQFDKPLQNQKELCLITRDKDLFLNDIGNAHNSELPSILYDTNCPKGELKIFHNHPVDKVTKKSYPLSLGDIYILASDNVHSITAFNHLGEFNTATLKEPLKYPWSISQFIIRTFQNRLEPIVGKNVDPTNNPELYTTEIHKAYKELLSQFNIEYTTNYSYLSK